MMMTTMTKTQGGYDKMGPWSKSHTVVAAVTYYGQ